MKNLVEKLWQEVYKNYPLDIDREKRWVLAGHPWQSAVVWVNKLKANLGDGQGKRVLEAGCGSGKISIKSARELDCHIFLLDYSRDALLISRNLLEASQRHDKRKYKAYFIQADIKFLPFKDSVFDLVFNEGVIEHWDDNSLRHKILKQMADVAKNKSKILVWVPNKVCIFNKFWSMTGWPGYLRGVREYPLGPKELKALMTETGLWDVAIEPVEPEKSFFVWPGVLKIFKPLYIVLFYIKKLFPVLFLKDLQIRLSRELLGIGRKV